MFNFTIPRAESAKIAIAADQPSASRITSLYSTICETCERITSIKQTRSFVNNLVHDILEEQMQMPVLTEPESLLSLVLNKILCAIVVDVSADAAKKEQLLFVLERAKTSIKFSKFRKTTNICWILCMNARKVCHLVSFQNLRRLFFS